MAERQIATTNQGDWLWRLRCRIDTSWRKQAKRTGGNLIGGHGQEAGWESLMSLKFNNIRWEGGKPWDVTLQTVYVVWLIGKFSLKTLCPIVCFTHHDIKYDGVLAQCFQMRSEFAVFLLLIAWKRLMACSDNRFTPRSILIFTRKKV